jgi:lipid II:glycine glycyltransferase (peptidoglycan interpeptide bridge formation enzyme)
MLYHGIQWKNLVESLTGAKPMYILVRMEGEIVGALPAFMKENPQHGNVLNSLPYYGSNGGPIISPALSRKEGKRLKKDLLTAFKRLAAENHCVTSTLISSVFENDIFTYDKALRPDFVDSRIEQVTILKPSTVDVETQLLYHTVDKRCRVAIRKAQNSAITVEFAQDLRDFETFYEMHKKSIMNKNGIYKPVRFFELAFKIFKQNESFKLLFARKQGEIIGGLLLFYYKNMVEYYTPCFKLEYSDLQPLSLLIFEGMKDAIKNGYTMWNFGGTWHSQQGVLRFKRSWGPQQTSYYYYINRYRDIDSIMSLSPNTIVSEYPWFYVIPFNVLKTKKE